MDTVTETNPENEPAQAAEQSTVTFAEGLIGMPAAKRFRFEVSEEIQPLVLMRSLDQDDLGFLLVDPKLVTAAYEPEFPQETLASVGLKSDEPFVIMAITKVSGNLEQCTANLVAPLLINPKTMHGTQVVLDSPSWHTAHPLVTQSV